ncbi:MAG: TetR/AcrR family transcriptional regulator [Treponema sp.]|nr:TetR/AcrR family transcriptional regulator [Treponema sp.]
MSNNTFMNENPSETKILMAETLKQLIKDKPFSKITVQDIVAACNINRNTFYYHFDNNYDLLYFTYMQEVQNIVESFRNAKASIPQAMDFVLDYIDKNIPLCNCAYESLGEQELKNIFEKDILDFVRATIEYFGEENNLNFSEDLKTFVAFSYSNLLSTQIIWYIRHNQDLDKEIFKACLQTFFTASLKSVLEEAVKKGL